MDHTLSLIAKAHEGDKEARCQVVEENMGLVYCVAARFDHRGHDRDEIIQVASLGLLKAVDRFDLNYDVRFSTYAVPVISGEIKRFLRDDGMVKVSRGLKENAYRIRQTMAGLEGELGREVTIAELSQATGISQEDIILAMDADAKVESIYRPAYEKDGEEICLIDQLAAQGGAGETQVVDRLVLEEVLAQLDELARRLIDLRFFQEKTQTQIARELQMSQVQVSRMEKKVLGELREKINEH